MEKFFIKNFQLGFWSLVLLWIANRLGLSKRNTKYGKQVRCMTFSSYSCSSSRIVSQSYKEQHCNDAELREIFFSLTEAAAEGVLLKKVFSKILQHSQGITSTGNHLSLLFNEVAGLRPANSLIKRLWHRCFSVKVAKFLRSPFFAEYFRTTASVLTTFGDVSVKQSFNENLFFSFCFYKMLLVAFRRLYISILNRLLLWWL